MIGNFLFARLKNHSGVSGYVGSRIYPSILPQGVKYPAILYKNVAGDPARSQQGDSNLFTREILISSYAVKPAKAELIADQVTKALNNYSGMAGGVTVSACFENDRSNDYDSTVKKFLVRQFFTIKMKG